MNVTNEKVNFEALEAIYHHMTLPAKTRTTKRLSVQVRCCLQIENNGLDTSYGTLTQSVSRPSVASQSFTTLVAISNSKKKTPRPSIRRSTQGCSTFGKYLCPCALPTCAGASRILDPVCIPLSFPRARKPACSSCISEFFQPVRERSC